jgi:hypothetical protein
MSRQLSLIAVPETDKDQSSGVITYWRLSGTTDFEALKQEWVSDLPNGYFQEPDLLSPPSPMVALKRAFEDWAPPGAMIKPLKDKDGYTAILRVGSEQEAQQRWQSERSAWFEKHTPGMPRWISEMLRTWFRYPLDVNAGANLENAYNVELGKLHPSDMSSWFVRMAERLQAVSLRDTGGFYFVPRAQVARWEKFSEIVGRVSDHQIMTIPAMAGEQAALAILTALTEEVTSQTQQMYEALEAEKYGKRAIATKIDACSAMLTKIGSYEILLGQKLESLADSAQQLRAKFVQAEMVARAKDRDGG